ncbi:MAG TPA: HD domain-containing protein, partial [Candidatus Gracilibacteria bacterium]|nr:HD domain-containing protein [Candidatus Gracilibacteria bacterium]
MLTFEKILKKVMAYRPDFDRERLVRAYNYACRFHEGQYRLSGDSYMTHVLAVLDILLSLQPDEDTLVAAMLHGLTTKPYDAAEITRLFGHNVALLLNAFAGLRRVKARDQNIEAESIRRMFMSMAKDLRVVLIKMADRLHNMQTIGFHPAAKQKQIARETLDVYVPISARLGIYHMKGQLEDRAFH